MAHDPVAWRMIGAGLAGAAIIGAAGGFLNKKWGAWAGVALGTLGGAAFAYFAS